MNFTSPKISPSLDSLYIIFFLILFISPFHPSYGQQKHTISGYVKDAENGEEVIGATVYIEEIKNGTVTNVYGFYSITLDEGTYHIKYSYIGMNTISQEVNLDQDISINIELPPSNEELQEVVIKGEAEDENITSISMSKNKVNVEQIKKLPALFGEPDVIQNIQKMPGVISAGEGTTGFFVRGGGADQNLILIDEAPVYDASHLFGLFSVFNADVIKSAELYKGGIPSRYGGRLSSILEVRTKDGNNKKFGGSTSLGSLASKVMLEGPIGKDEKSSFIFSGRRSYFDLFMKAADQDNLISFYDINAKVNWKPSNKDRIFFATYTGRDRFSFGDLFQFNWGNLTGTLRWNHLFNEKLFSNTTIIASNFDYELESKDEGFNFLWTASLQTLSLKEDLTYFINPSNELNFGLQTTYRRFSPGEISTGGQSNFIDFSIDNSYALDHSLYIGNDQTVSDKLSIQYGLRYTIFQPIGPGTYYDYYTNSDGVFDRNNEDNKIDSLVAKGRSSTYDRLEVVETFHNIEPRFSTKYMINGVSSAKLSYNRMVQYIHLLSNSTVPVPFNTWTPSSPYLEPQKSDQIALGYFRNFDANKYEFSVETYYKYMQSVTDFADNAQLFLNENVAVEYRQGESYSYGVELFLQKNKGDVTGFASYTLSKTERQIPEVNNDFPFFANYDRRHNFNIVGTYSLSEKWDIGGSFTYASGRPITLPTGSYSLSNNVNPIYISQRNGFRLPDIHRLDLSFTLNPLKNKNRSWKSAWNFSIYNAYNRKNPFTVYTRNVQDDDGNLIEGREGEKEARLISLFPVLPSVLYTIKF